MSVHLGIDRWCGTSMLSEAIRLEALRETPDTMREKLQAFREFDPDAYRRAFRTLLPADALASDALSDRQLEVNCRAMLASLSRIARRDRGLAKLH
jgi:hypothetical protein